jgi:hypothetical protein
MAFVLLWAAISKLTDLNVFYQALSRSGLVASVLLVPVTLLVPSLELTLAIFLFLGGAPEPAAISVLTLFTAFLAWQIASIVRGSPEGCACLKIVGMSDGTLGPSLRIVRGVILCGVAYLVFHRDVIAPRRRLGSH